MNMIELEIDCKELKREIQELKRKILAVKYAENPKEFIKAQAELYDIAESLEVTI